MFSRGRIVATGGPELADELERTGYTAFDPDPDHDGAPPAATPPADPFADPFA